MSDDYEGEDYDESGSVPTEEDLSEGELSEEGASGEDIEFSDEEGGYDIPVNPQGQFWKGPITGVSISFGGAPTQMPLTGAVAQPPMSYAPQPSFTPQIYAPQAPTLGQISYASPAGQAIYAGQASYPSQASFTGQTSYPSQPIFEILPAQQTTMTPLAPVVSAPPPATTPTQQQPVTFETLGRNFIVRSLPGLLTPYRVYFENLRGKYDETTNTWTFLQRQEAQVRDLFTRIATGQLPPPDQLPLPSAQEVSIDVSAVGQLPMKTAPPPAPVAPELTVTPPVSGTYAPPVSAAPPPPTAAAAPVSTYLPSQVIQATMPPSIAPVPTPQPAVMGGTPQIPPYDPTTKEASESQQEYDRRIQLYRHLTGLGLPTDSADLLARMRNQVDIYGVSYDPSAMQILNTYLPLAQ